MARPIGSLWAGARFLRLVRKKSHVPYAGTLSPEAFYCDDPKHQGVSFTYADKYLWSERGRQELHAKSRMPSQDFPAIVQIHLWQIILSRVWMCYRPVTQLFAGDRHFETSRRLSATEFPERADKLRFWAARNGTVMEFVKKDAYKSNPMYDHFLMESPVA